jgi:ABC-type transporter Mla MlaB component
MSEDGPDTARVTFSGSLSVRTIAQAHATLRQALAKHASVRVDCANAETVDLSFIQLLLSAHRGGREAGRSLMLDAPPTGALRAALEQGGFLPDSGADPFWMQDA